MSGAIPPIPLIAFMACIGFFLRFVFLHINRKDNKCLRRELKLFLDVWLI
jgi:hypothetical protein